MSHTAQQYLALVLTDEWVTASIWQYLDGSVSVLSQSQVVVLKQGPKSKTSDGQSAENTVNQSYNDALDQALDELGDEGLTLKNVLYVLPHHWVSGNDLAESKKTFLKRLSQDLVLEPLGFVVLTDTIAAVEAEKHGVNFSGLIIVDTPGFIDVAMYQDGLEQKVERVGKSGTVQLDVQELQARLQSASSEILKRAIFLTSPERDTSDLEQALQSQLAITLETLQPDTLAKNAVSSGGREVLAANDDAAPTSHEKSEATHQQSSAAAEQKDDDAPLLNQPPAGFTPPTFIQNTGLTLPPEDAVNGSDSDLPVQEGDNFTSQPTNPTSQDNASAAQFQSPDFIGSASPDAEGEPQTVVDGIQPGENSPHTQTARQRGAGLFGLSLPSVTIPKLSSFLGSGGSRKKTLLMLAGTGVGVLLLALVGVYFGLQQMYTVRADIWLAAEEIAFSDTFITGENVRNASQSAITAEIFEESVTLEEEVPTTGSKIIGDPAKGRVKVLNKTSQDKNFAAGTIISSNGVTFTLDEDISVASASSQESSDSRTISFGSQEVGVTAVDIGPEGNLGKDTAFTVANFDTSSYEARNDAEFTGGASREIQAVAQADIDDTVEALEETGAQQIVEKIESGSAEGEYVFFTDQVEVEDISPSTEVGEEAKFVTVSVTVVGQGLRIQEDDLQAVAQDVLASQVDEKQTLLSESVDLEPESIRPNTDDSFTLEAKITGKAVQQVQASELKEQLAGAYRARATQILNEDTRIARHQLSVQPSWLGWIFSSIPSNLERLQLNIQIEQE